MQRISIGEIQTKLLREGARLPIRATDGSAGCDLCACLPDIEECMIWPHQTVMVPTGLAMAIPEGMFGGIFARSGLASRYGLRPANCVGVVDSDYRGEVMVALHNDMDEPRKIVHGERIAQLVILPAYVFDFRESADLDDTVRGAGGFGSTGSRISDPARSIYTDQASRKQ